MAVIVSPSRPRETAEPTATTVPMIASTEPAMCVMLLKRSPAYMRRI